ncbi:MAG: hypothetical protein HC771_12915 [Synechococcales cyanobacterium CRU_2_2]|nr:hypothetical protein [Synechococcales cyanobacterium CRU_2_2]
MSLDPDSRRSLILQQDPFQWVDDFFEEQGIFVPLFSIPLAIIPGSGGIYRGGTVKFIKPILYYADGSCSTEDPQHNPEYLRTDFERVDAFTLSD